MDKNFNPFYDSDFLISRAGEEERRFLVELNQEDLLRLREEIDLVLKGMDLYHGASLAADGVDPFLETKATLKISPEELKIINVVLRLTADEVSSHFGAFTPGEEALEYGRALSGTQGKASMYIKIYPRRTPNQENHIDLSLYMHNDTEPYITVAGKARLNGVTSLEGEYSIKDKNGHTWTIDLHADERYRRIGREYIFQTDSHEEAFAAHQGQVCTVLRETPYSNNDPLYSGLMWQVQFKDGVTLDAWDFELRHTPERQADLEQNPGQQKPGCFNSLNAKIASAEAHHNIPTNSHFSSQLSR